MKKRVLFINSAIYLPGEGGYKRTMYLFDLMTNLGYSATLVTGDFNHYQKKKRDVLKFYEDYPQYSNIKILPKLKYKRNISFKRFLSDFLFAFTTKKWVIKNLKNYDVVYINMPNIEGILQISPLCKKNEIPLVVDVRDLWPEAFKVFIKNKYLYNLLTFPLKKMADKAYKCADELVAVSKEYLERALECNEVADFRKVIYIGSSLEKFDQGVSKYSSLVSKKNNEFWIVYIGTIGASYDFKTVIDAVSDLEGSIPITFKIIGSGPEEKSLKEYCKCKSVTNVDFLGFMDYEMMAAYLSHADIGMNNIKKDASQSIINKVGDYFAAGLPVLNSCKNEEMQELIEFYNAGLNYEAENKEDLVKKILELYSNSNIRKEMSKNSRTLAEEKFNRSQSYLEIINVIDKAQFHHFSK